jgi:hypothetical protein
VRLVVTVALMLFFAAPVFLGPATGLLLHALGGEVEHQCACGMARGKCGCPECALEERDRAERKQHHPYAVLKSSCEDDDGVPALGALPPAMPTPPFVVHRVAFAERAQPIAPPALDSVDGPPPPTPPPRRLAA